MGDLGRLDLLSHVVEVSEHGAICILVVEVIESVLIDGITRA